MHPNVSKLLDYYVKEGTVDLTKLHLPGPQPNSPLFRHLFLRHRLANRRQNEVIPYNDCFYRNVHKFDKVVLLDIDEIIVPTENENWHTMLDKIESNKPGMVSYCFPNVYFMDDMLEANLHHSHFEDIPQYLHMMQHVYRSRQYSKKGYFVKCMHSTEKVKTLHNHYPLHCLGVCYTDTQNVTVGHLQHYRKTCVKEISGSCAKKFRNDTELDNRLWRYKDKVIERTKKTLIKLGFID